LGLLLYGNRLGSVTYPFGYVWRVSTHEEDLSPEELKQPAAKAMQQGGD
jgi:PhnB protein